VTHRPIRQMLFRAHGSRSQPAPERLRHHDRAPGCPDRGLLKAMPHPQRLLPA
jgi:hypothetical protein